jgi:LysM domain
MTAVLFPDLRFQEFPTCAEFEVRLGNNRPAHAVYVRRRLVVAMLVLGLITAIGVSARAALADRGGVPASTPAIRSANLASASASGVSPAPAAVVPVIRYIVQPGDTLWSLAERFRGTHGMSSYVDSLVTANGGSTVQPGQLLLLP